MDSYTFFAILIASFAVFIFICNSDEAPLAIPYMTMLSREQRTLVDNVCTVEKLLKGTQKTALSFEHLYLYF